MQLNDCCRVQASQTPSEGLSFLEAQFLDYILSVAFLPVLRVSP